MKIRSIVWLVILVGMFTILSSIQPAPCSAWWEAKYKQDDKVGNNIVAAQVYRDSNWVIHPQLYMINGSVVPGPENPVWGYLWGLKEWAVNSLWADQSAGWKTFGVGDTLRKPEYWLGGKADLIEIFAQWMRGEGFVVHTYSANCPELWLTTTSGSGGIWFRPSWAEYDRKVLPYMRSDSLYFMQEGR